MLYFVSGICLGLAVGSCIVLGVLRARKLRLGSTLSGDDVLRKMLYVTSTTDPYKAGKGIVDVLSKCGDFNLASTSVLLWQDTRKQLSYLYTNIPTRYRDDMLSHILELQLDMTLGNRSASITSVEEGTLSYCSAKERGIMLEYYIPLMRNGAMIGALYVESATWASRKQLTLHFFNLVVENVNLIVYNLVLLRRVVESANTDALTQCYTRAFLNMTMKQLQGEGCGYSVIMLDIDHFKVCNDTYGHLVGDVVLRNVAQGIRGCIRTNYDKLFRYGGEEFLIVLLNCSLEQATRKAEVIRKEIETMNIFYDKDKYLNVTISLGVHSKRKLEGTESVISQADKCLYSSKETGRNKVTSSLELEELNRG